MSTAIKLEFEKNEDTNLFDLQYCSKVDEKDYDIVKYIIDTIINSNANTLEDISIETLEGNSSIGGVICIEHE